MAPMLSPKKLKMILRIIAQDFNELLSSTPPHTYTYFKSYRTQPNPIPIEFNPSNYIILVRVWGGEIKQLMSTAAAAAAVELL